MLETGDVCGTFSYFYFAVITNYHKLSVITQIYYLCSVGQKSEWLLDSAQGLTGLKSRCRLHCLPFWSSRAQTPSMIIQVIGRIRFLEVVGLKSHSLDGCQQGPLSAPRGLSLVPASGPSTSQLPMVLTSSQA